MIGASAGGLTPIRDIVRELPESFQATVVVATHRDPSVKPNMLAHILARDARLTVREPMEGETLACTTVYVGAPGDSVLVDGRDVHLEEVFSNRQRITRIDELFFSAAAAARENAVGVILSGTLRDGVAGLQAIHDVGGTCIVQDPVDASFADMPRNALENIIVDLVGNTTEIGKFLMKLAAERDCQ